MQEPKPPQQGIRVTSKCAKRLEGPYLPGQRNMIKVKHGRDADCVVGGAASFTAADQLRLLEELEPLRKGAVRNGEPGRWNSAADKQWVPVGPECVAEVAYDEMAGVVGWQRFRRPVRFHRWRPDCAPQSCTFDQLDMPVRYELSDVLEAR